MTGTNTNRYKSTNHSPSRILYKELSYKIVGLLFQVHNELGDGHKEKYYENALAVALDQDGIKYKRQVGQALTFRDKVIGKYYLDFLIDDKIVLELKRGERFSQKHINQVKEYLRVTGLQLAILATFRQAGVKTLRIVNLPNYNNPHS